MGMSNNLERPTPSRRGGGGREEGWGRLRRPASCSPAASHLPPMGDASVPTPLLTSPAPTNVTICLKKPTVERLCGCRRPHYSVTPDGSYSYVIVLKDKDGGAS